jgi:hypothetical protein
MMVEIIKIKKKEMDVIGNAMKVYSETEQKMI